MKFVLSTLSSLIALLGCVTPARATESLRLDEISVVRFVQLAPHQWSAKHGLLSTGGEFRETAVFPVLSSVSIPADALNRNLITLEAWLAYSRLGPDAVSNFVTFTEGTSFLLGQRYYYEVAPVPNPQVAQGRLLALSTRAFVPAAEPVIAGFIVEDRPRRVLIRAVGQSLAAHGVANPIADPGLALYRHNTLIDQNDDWQQRTNASEISHVSAALGLLPFVAGSKESALLVDLPPGLYTAHLRAQSGSPGIALVEIYSVP